MPRQGRGLEQLVAVIERVIGNDSRIEIESPKRLPDRTTTRLREHDVVLTLRQAHHILQVAIECRDRSRPVGVPQVEAFSAKCLDTGINQGIIVSPSGFYASARKKAGHLGVRCLDMEEVKAFPWLQAPGMRVLTRRLLNHDWKFMVAENGFATKETMEVLTHDGQPLDLSLLTTNAQQILREALPQDAEPTEMAQITVRVSGSGLRLRNTATGATTSVKCADVTLTYSLSIEFIPFRLAQYGQKAARKSISDVAVAEIKLGDVAGKMMIIHNDNDGGRIVFAPDPLMNTKESGTRKCDNR